MEKIEFRKEYKKKNRSKINSCERQKRKTDFKCKLICNIRRRTNKAFKSQTIKTNKTIDLIGCSQSFFNRWILHQLYGDMTEENYGSVWTIDHCYPLSKTDQSNETDKIKITCWINLRPMFSNKNISRVLKLIIDCT